MGRLVTFDLDEALSKVRTVAEEAPQLISLAEAAGWGGAAKLSALVPLAGPIAGLLTKLAGKSDGLTEAGMPDTGPRGKGRLSYLRQRRNFDDAAVVRACESITMRGFAQSKAIADTVNFTLSCMYPDTAAGKWSDEQTRAAIDKILDEDGLSEGVCDKLGDMIFYALSHRPSTGTKEGQ